MAKAVLISIRPEWAGRILSGEKTLEVRKTRPKLETPFKCYIYCTKPKRTYEDYIVTEWGDFFDWPNKGFFGGGLVVGEFVCDRIAPIVPAMEPYGIYDVDDDFVAQTGLVNGALWDYGNGATLYGGHVSRLKVYDKPVALAAFRSPDLPTGLRYEDAQIKRSPQSWCYVENIE